MTWSRESEITENFSIYKSIDPSIEFGISRTISDKLYHLPKLLSNPELIWQEGTTSYIIKSATQDSHGSEIILEHRLQDLEEFFIKFSWRHGNWPTKLDNSHSPAR